MAVTTFGEGSNAVAVEHEDDWSGEAVLLWREGERYKRGSLPGRILRAIVDSVRAEALLTAASNILDEATSKLADTADAVERLSADVEKASLRPPPPAK